MQLGNLHGKLCADLGAGSGDMSQLLPPDSLCVEKDAARVEEGKAKAPLAYWKTADALASGFVSGLMNGPAYDVVVSNPPFERGFAFLYLGLMMVAGSQSGSTATEG